jgi:histidyl-tRNA synthetase
MLDHLSEVSRSEFELFKQTLTQAKLEFTVNPRIVRGLDYYEKTAFEFTSSELGSQSAFAGGGRYNNLVKDLGGDDVPGVGWALGCERLIMLMKAEQEKQPASKCLSGVYFVAMGEACFGKARELLQQLRDAGVKAEMDYSSKSFKSQMRRADKLGFRYAAILGENELAKNVVMLKDLGSGEQREVPVADLLKQQL